MRHITLVPFNKFKHRYAGAMEIMKNIDIKDSAFIALAMALNADGIWTEDKDFLRQNEVKVFSTKKLTEIMEGI